MKPATQPKARRKGKTAKATEPAARRAHAPSVPNTVREWAKGAVKKTPVDTGEGGSGQP